MGVLSIFFSDLGPWALLLEMKIAREISTRGRGRVRNRIVFEVWYRCGFGLVRPPPVIVEAGEYGDGKPKRRRGCLDGVAARMAMSSSSSQDSRHVCDGVSICRLASYSSFALIKKARLKKKSKKKSRDERRGRIETADRTDNKSQMSSEIFWLVAAEWPRAVSQKLSDVVLAGVRILGVDWIASLVLN